MNESDKYVRTMTVRDWISECRFSNHTLHKLIEQKFGLKSFSARTNVINEALAMLQPEWDKDQLKIKNAERLDAIMQLAIEKDDIKGAISAIQVQNKMFGLEIDKKDIEVKGESFEIKFG